MTFRRWFSPMASAAAITLLGGLTAFAVEGVVEEEPVAAVQEEELEEAGDEETEDLIFDIEIDTPGDDVASEDLEGEDRPDNHGQTVSEFARVTSHEMGLTGCERGHAISAVARGADPANPMSSDLYKPCNEDDVDDLESGEIESADVDEDEDRGGPPHGEPGPPPGKGPNGDGPAAAAAGKGRGGR